LIAVQYILFPLSVLWKDDVRLLVTSYRRLFTEVLDKAPPITTPSLYHVIFAAGLVALDTQLKVKGVPSITSTLEDGDRLILLTGTEIVSKNDHYELGVTICQ
jgi:hypothetical protein